MIKVGLILQQEDLEHEDSGIARYEKELDKRFTGQQIDNVIVDKIVLPKSKQSIISKAIFTAMIDTKPYDIMHIPVPMPYFPLLFRKHKNIVITTAHDFMPSALIATDQNIIERRWLRWLADMRLSLKSDYLITNSTKTRDEAIELGFDKDKIKVINLGIDNKFFTPIKRKKSKIFRIGYIGTFPPRKNVGFAIDAVKSMKGKDIRFDIYGRQDMEYINLRTQALGDRRIHFYGRQDDESLPLIYDSLDVSVFPSLEEGYGLPILEAQARGLPVVIYSKARIPLEVKKMCFLAKDVSDMTNILQDLKENGFNAKRKKATIAYARNFTWERHIKETVEFYNKVIQ